jgi:hypothetical protein
VSCAAAVAPWSSPVPPSRTSCIFWLRRLIRAVYILQSRLGPTIEKILWDLGPGYRDRARAKTPLSVRSFKVLKSPFQLLRSQIHISLPPKSPPPSRSTATYFSHLAQQQTHQPPSRAPPTSKYIKKKPHTATRHHTPSSHSRRITAAAEPLDARVFTPIPSQPPPQPPHSSVGGAQPRPLQKVFPATHQISITKQRFSPAESPSSQSADRNLITGALAGHVCVT